MQYLYWIRGESLQNVKILATTVFYRLKSALIIDMFNACIVVNLLAVTVDQ